MEKQGLKGAFAQYLMALHRHPEGMTASQLCEECDMNKAAVSRAIGEMEACGLVAKQSEGDSSYRALLFLTEQGRQVVQFVYARGVIAVEKGGEGLTEENRRIFYDALKLIEGNLHRICRSGLPDEE